MTWLRRHPLGAFFVLAFVLPWLVWVPRAAGVPVGVLDPLSTWFAAVAALAAALLAGGRGGLRDLGRRLVRWRVGWSWWVVVLVGPAAFSVAAAALVVLLGGTWSTALPTVLAEQAWALLAAYLLVSVFTDGLGEEVAWRGFALPRLLSRSTPVVASVVLGLLWGAWHLPLLWTEGAHLHGQLFWLLLVDILAKSFLFTWVFLHTSGSALIAVLFHATTNVFAVSPTGSAGDDLTLPLVAAALKWVLVALVLAGGGLALPRAAGRWSEVTTAGDIPGDTPKRGPAMSTSRHLPTRAGAASTRFDRQGNRDDHH
jgi:membrane protease YdiL (CAAX protease family)